MKISTSKYGGSGDGIITSYFEAEDWAEAGYDDWAKVYNAIWGISPYEHGNEYRVAMKGGYMGLPFDAVMRASHIKDGHIHMRIKIGRVENDFHVPLASAMTLNASHGTGRVKLGTTTLDVYLSDVYDVKGANIHASGTRVENMCLFSKNWIRGELPVRGRD